MIMIMLRCSITAKTSKMPFTPYTICCKKTDAAGENLTQDENGSTVYQVIEVIAEAVQAEPISAAQEAWGVVVTNNIITVAP